MYVREEMYSSRVYIYVEDMTCILHIFFFFPVVLFFSFPPPRSLSIPFLVGVERWAGRSPGGVLEGCVHFGGMRTFWRHAYIFFSGKGPKLHQNCTAVS